MFNLFKQKTATLYNGKKVKEGDRVFFTNSDGKRVVGTIEKRKFDVHYDDCTFKKGSLYFLNANFDIKEYRSLDLV